MSPVPSSCGEQFEDFELPFRGLFFNGTQSFRRRGSRSGGVNNGFRDLMVSTAEKLVCISSLTARARHNIVIGDGDDRRELQKVHPHRVAGPLPRPRPWTEIIPFEVVVAVTAED